MVHKKCKVNNCYVQPHFNFDGEKKPLYCLQHKLEGMIDIINKRCKEKNCSVQPSFNHKGEKKAVYCFQHKLNDMVDVRSKKCIEKGCFVQPRFNYKGEKKGLYCTNHKLPEMIDICSKKCKQENCKVNPYFNYIGEKFGIYCMQHRLPEMINVITKTCKEKNCIIQPQYNYEKEKTGLYCSNHKKLGMIDVKSPKCQICKMTCVERKRVICFSCRSQTAKIKRRETVILEALNSDETLRKYTSQDQAHPCAKQMGLGKYRVDFSWELPDKVIILEVDENEHQNYNVECEQKRIHQLHEIFAKPLLIFRYNPDHVWVTMGKRKRNAADSEKHAWLVSQLVLVLQSKFDDIDKCVIVRGSDEMKVLYAGYSEKRIDELWDWINLHYNNKIK